MPGFTKPQQKSCYTLLTKSGEIPYFLTRSPRRRTIEITVAGSADVSVKAPRYAAEKEIRDFIHEKSEWIIKKIHEIRLQQEALNKRGYENGHQFLFLGKQYPVAISEGRRKSARVSFDGRQWIVEVPKNIAGRQRQSLVKEKLIQWYRQQAEELLGSRLFHYARLMGSGPRKIAVRTQKRIWGSCSKSQQRINLNWCLIMAPLPVIDYVVVHELCHLEVANHSRRFWKKVEKIFPDYKIRQKWLRSRAGDMALP